MTGISRLRALAERKNFLEPAEARELDAISDQIERERECDRDTIENLRLELGEARDPAADVSMNAYDLLPQEDRDAIAWVRDQGGLDAVKRRWECLSYYADPVPRSYAERRIAARQRQIDESHAALRRRNARIVELEQECDELREMVRSLNALTDEMEKRLMPEGMEWPRFEDGEPVHIGDVFGYGVKQTSHDVTSILFNSEGCFIEPDYSWEGGDYELMVKHGERVKRPTPKVLDAGGVEVELGDDLYSVEGGLKFHVSHIDRINGKIATDAMFSLDKWADPAMFTHRAPVLAADGKPLREGEHVWHVETGTELVVKELPKHGEYQAVVVFAPPASHLTSFDPDQLTHERPDSFEQMEKDANDLAYDIGFYLGDYSPSNFKEPGDTIQDRIRDLVRRAKKLAGDA